MHVNIGIDQVVITNDSLISQVIGDVFSILITIMLAIYSHIKNRSSIKKSLELPEKHMRTYREEDHQRHLEEGSEREKELIAFLEENGLADLAPKFCEFGINSLHDYTDDHLVNDQTLRSELNLTDDEINAYFESLKVLPYAYRDQGELRRPTGEG